MPGVSGIILLGGGSRRMGRDKAQLPLGGETLVQRTTDAVAHVADEVVLVRARGLPPTGVISRRPVIEVSDPIEDGGPLVGLAAGLGAARHDIALVAGVDLPFLQPALLQFIAERLQALRAAGVQWVVPEVGAHLQPLCSAFATDVLETIHAQIEAGERSLIALEGVISTHRLSERTWRLTDPEGLSFLDVDTPEEYAAALARYERLGDQG